MKIIEYIKLVRYLMDEEGLEFLSAYRNVQRVRALPKEYKEAVYAVVNGGYPTLETAGVSFDELTDKEGIGMKPIRAILMLDWLRREPAVAMRYMATQRMRTPIRPLSEDEEAQVRATLERLKCKEKPLETENKTDITIE